MLSWEGMKEEIDFLENRFISVYFDWYDMDVWNLSGGVNLYKMFMFFFFFVFNLCYGYFGF